MNTKCALHRRPGSSCLLTLSSQDWAFETVAADEASETASRAHPISLQNFMNRGVEGAKMMGRNIDVTTRYKKWMLELGFVDVVERQILCP